MNPMAAGGRPYASRPGESPGGGCFRFSRLLFFADETGHEAKLPATVEAILSLFAGHLIVPCSSSKT